MSALSQIHTNRLEQILTLEGPEFIGQAYLLLLGRPVDPDGFRNYENHLRAGASKLSVLVELHASQEGQARAADIPDVTRFLNQAEGGAGSMVATSIEQLLALDDVSFVDSAYRTLLGRTPDASGFSHYLKLLRAGASKMRIVSQMYFSAEAREAARSLPGVKRAIRRYWLASNWLTGWWYRSIVRVEADTPLECRLRAVENALMRMVHDRERESQELAGAADDVALLLQTLTQHRSA